MDALKDQVELQAIQSEVADRRVEALRLAYLTGTLDAFLQEEKQRADERYKSARTRLESISSRLGGTLGEDFSETEAGGGGSDPGGPSSGIVGEPEGSEGVQPSGGARIESPIGESRGDSSGRGDGNA